MAKRDYYQELKDKGLSDKEIAENYVFPIERTEEERKEDARILSEYRAKRRAEMTEQEKKELEEFAEKLRKQDEED